MLYLAARTLAISALLTAAVRRVKYTSGDSLLVNGLGMAVGGLVVDGLGELLELNEGEVCLESRGIKSIDGIVEDANRFNENRCGTGGFVAARGRVGVSTCTEDLGEVDSSSGRDKDDERG